MFNVGLNTGIITVANSAALDYEATPVLTLLVQVKDPEALTEFGRRHD